MPQSQQHKGLALALSCVSAAAAETATYPIDAIKTQLQLQHGTSRSLTNSSSTPTAGAGQLTRQVLQKHGLSGLYAGLSPAVLRHIFYTGTRITLYEQLKTAYAAHRLHTAAAQAGGSNASSSSNGQAGTAAGPAEPPAAPIWAGLLFGLTAGGVGQLVAVPADLIKVTMQADVRTVMSGRRQHRQFTSISSVATVLTRQHGLAGLWRGGLPAVQRAALVNLGELSTYDSAKQAIAQSGLLPAGLPTHLAASICSGFVSALISTPADVIKTRLMAQAVMGSAGAGQAHQPQEAAATVQAGSTHGRNGATGSSTRSFNSSCSAVGSSSSSTCSRHYRSAAGDAMPHYRGMVDCAVQTVRQEGLLAMYKGFWPTWARLGPWQLVFWVTYEQLRMLANIQAF